MGSSFWRRCRRLKATASSVYHLCTDNPSPVGASACWSSPRRDAQPAAMACTPAVSTRSSTRRSLRRGSQSPTSHRIFWTRLARRVTDGRTRNAARSPGRLWNRRFVQGHLRPRPGDRHRRLVCGPGGIVRQSARPAASDCRSADRRVVARHRREHRALHLRDQGRQFQVWQRILDELVLQGDETVLDMGCGRGAVLLATAKRLPNGRAVGVDSGKPDQTDNSPSATLANAEIEGVKDRIELHTADMTALPFADNSFDVIVSSLAIHNIPGHAGRRTALNEAMRVLKPGGRLAIADLWETKQHAEHLRPRVGSRSSGKASDGGCGTAARGLRRILSPRQSRDESRWNSCPTLRVTGHLVAI